MRAMLFLWPYLTFKVVSNLVWRGAQDKQLKQAEQSSHSDTRHSTSWTEQIDRKCCAWCRRRFICNYWVITSNNNSQRKHTTSSCSMVINTIGYIKSFWWRWQMLFHSHTETTTLPTIGSSLLSIIFRFGCEIFLFSFGFGIFSSKPVLPMHSNQ